jgi:tetratricopeptide (TPR) repeat protein
MRYRFTSFLPLFHSNENMAHISRRRRRTRLPDLRPASFAFAGLLVLAPELIGGAPGWATVALACLATLVAALAFRLSRDQDSARSLLEPVVIVQAAAVLLTLAQIVPLPAGLTKWLSPVSWEEARAAASALQRPEPSWIPFSSDPGGSHERLLFGLTTLLALCIARLLARVGTSSGVLLGVVASALVLCGSSLFHVTMELGHVFGLYEPRFVWAPLWGPIMNPNNLAGVMAFGTPLALGFACRRDSTRMPRVAWALGALAMLTTALLTLSRGGMAAAMLGVLLFGALYALRPAGQDGSRRVRTFRALALFACVAAGASVLAIWAGSDPLGEDYGDTTKLEMFRQELTLLREHPVLGIGRGAFAAASTSFYSADSRALYAENIFLQYASEFGIPFAVLFLGTIFARVLSGLFRWQSATELGALVGVLTILLHNFVDFGMELTGVSTLVFACLGAALPPFRWPGAEALPWPRIESRRLVGASALLSGVALLAFGLSVSLYSLDAMERTLADAILERDRTTFAEAFPRAVELHPADATIAMYGATMAIKTGGSDAGMWLNRTMRLAPNWSSPHGWAAHWLALLGHGDQALAELQLAAERDPIGSRMRLCTVLQKRPLADTALAVAPTTEPERRLLLETAADCLAAAPAEVERVDRELLAVDPLHPAATARSADRLLAKEDYDGALKMLEPLLARKPHIPVVYDSAARAWIASGKPAVAVRMMQQAMPGFEDPYQPLLTLADAQARAGDLAAMRATIETARGAAAGDVKKLAWALTALATSEQQTGNLARSMRVWREVYTLLGDPFALANAASLASRLGDDGFAREAKEQLCSAHSSQGYCDH